MSRSVVRPPTLLRIGVVLLLLAPAAASATGGTAIPVSRPASQVGRWEAPVKWPMGASHAIVLPTERVLLFAPEAGHHGLVAKVWDIRRNRFKDVSWDHHIHCSGHSFLADGSVLVTGGHDHENCPTQGRREANVFDPFTLTWVEMEPMNFTRYYPSNLTLGDGRVLVFSGFNDHCKAVPQVEVFEAGEGFRVVRGANRRILLYPRLHLLPNGEVAHVGPEPTTAMFDPDRVEWHSRTTTRRGEKRYAGTSFQIPGEPFGIMYCGGFARLNHLPTATCERIAYTSPNPKWRSAAPMRFPRGHANATLLPDHTVLMVGGGEDGIHDDPIFNAELYDPDLDAWRLLPPQRFERMHHSVAVLLPDGRVLSASELEDHHGNPLGGSVGAWAEIYRPPYLFRGPRPAIRRGPDLVRYGNTFEIKAKQAARIRSAVLVRPSAVTHSVNSTQRLVDLDFEHLGKRDLEIRAPSNPHKAPPGYYMLFILNEKGVPSEAHMLQLLPSE